MPLTSRAARTLMSALALALLAPATPAQQEVKSIPPAPPRAEGEGPWARLILRGVDLDRRHRRAARSGPVDIVIERNRIRASRTSATRACRSSRAKRPKAEAGDKEIDLAGHYVLPGFVDMHGHIGRRTSRARRPSTCSSSGWATASPPCATRAAATASTGWSRPSRRATRNEITAPRI